MPTKIVFDALRYQSSAGRTDSSTSASGLAAASSRQNAAPGQSTMATKSPSSASQSTGSPYIALAQPAFCSSDGNTSAMWWQRPPSSCSSATLSECVPVRPTPAPTTLQVHRRGRYAVTRGRHHRPGALALDGQRHVEEQRVAVVGGEHLHADGQAVDGAGRDRHGRVAVDVRDDREGAHVHEVGQLLRRPIDSIADGSFGTAPATRRTLPSSPRSTT